MTPELLHRIRTLYEAAVAMEPADRDRFMEQQAHGDVSIWQEVERLLSARERLPEWLAGPLLGPAGRAFDLVLNPSIGMEGRKIGGYRILREIGRGGMGSVYLAERADGAYRKLVAVKLVRPGENSAEILDRFRHEREILASLDHPNIARLIDGGSTEDGLPYFVMEYVEGRPINRWCDERKLNISQRLELFRSVCEAVHYAHQRLVVHRDLKPGNILVTPDGTVKLLDFGIARVVEEGKTRQLDATLTLLRGMTPEYASPEQVKGEPITTLTDVYSLGVVLYELLTGHRPYRLLSAAIHEIARVISEQEPTRPSDLVAAREEQPEAGSSETPATLEAVSEVREGDPNRLRKRLRGDLDCILLTALRKEPSRRYRSVESLSEDLARHLENLPVRAHEDSLWYRASRFVRRHPMGVAIAILVAAALGASVLTTAWELRVALEAAGERLSARSIMEPQFVLWLCISLAGFGGAVLLTGAKLLRVAGALAGATLFAVAELVKFKLDFFMGWWQSRIVDVPNPLSLFPQPLLFLTIAFASAILLLISWRVARRFGWRGQTIFFVAFAVWAGLRERVWFGDLTLMMAPSWCFYPVAADMALLGVGFTLAYALMLAVAGQPRDDMLSGPRRQKF